METRIFNEKVKYSNTTLVKVKCQLYIQFEQINSNSNTTLVKVKCISSRFVDALWPKFKYNTC